MFDKIFGLPVHILVVHAVVVLVPLCAVGAVVMLVSATWRERLRWAEVVLLTVAAGSAFVAKQSGENLKDQARQLHQRLAGAARDARREGALDRARCSGR